MAKLYERKHEYNTKPSDPVYMFEGTRQPKDLTRYTLFRGVTDYGTLAQFNMFDSSHSFFKILQYPKALQDLQKKDDRYKYLIQNALHCIEYEFKGLTGIEDIQSKTTEITNGINSINVITGVTRQSAVTLQTTYTEKKGALFTKFTELYLTTIMDTESGFKHYHGLTEDDDEYEDGFEKETFTILYWVTDVTGRRVEKAFLLLGAQLENSEQSIFNSTRGETDAPEITLSWNGFLAQSPSINKLANDMRESMYIVINNDKMDYSFDSNWTAMFDNPVKANNIFIPPGKPGSKIAKSRGGDTRFEQQFT